MQNYFSGEFVITTDRAKCVRLLTRDIRWHDENTIVFVTHVGQLQMMDVRTGQVVRIVDISFCRDVMLVRQFFIYYLNLETLLAVYFFAILLYFSTTETNVTLQQKIKYSLSNRT